MPPAHAGGIGISTSGLNETMVDYRIPDTRLGDDLLVLRTWNPDSEADVAAWLAGVTDAEFTRWNTPTRTIRSNREARESLLRRVDERRKGISAPYCIVDRRTDSVLGHVGINSITWEMKRAHVGFWLLPTARGRQVAARALAMAGQWAFDTLGLHRLELYHAVGNEASCRTAQRCGFALEGVLRDRMFQSGDFTRFRDAHLHARLASDPRTETD